MYKIGDQILDESQGKGHGTVFQCIEVDRSEFFTFFYFRNVRKDGTLGKLTQDISIRNESSASYPMVAGEGAPQYTFDVAPDTQLSLL